VAWEGLYLHPLYCVIVSATNNSGRYCMKVLDRKDITMLVFDSTVVSIIGQFIWPCLDASLNPGHAKVMGRDGSCGYLPL